MEHVRTVFKVAALISILALCGGCGPRMRDQASVQPYEMNMPNMPAGQVPTRGSLQTFTLQDSEQPPAEIDVDNGKLFYQYYCLMCHGARGDGNGPVGQSYVPKPTDLSSPTVTGMSDSELYRGMLNGTGHSPVLDSTVLPEHRWPIVKYVRTFAEGASAKLETAD